MPANTGEAGAIHRVACFAGMPAPTGTAQLQMLMIVHTFVWLMAPSIENGRYHPPADPA